MISLGLEKIDLLQIQKEAVDFARDCFERHDLSREETPPELADKTPRFNKTRDGRRISALLLPEDVAFGSESSVTLPAASMISSMWSLAALLGCVSGILGVIFVSVGMLVSTILHKKEHQDEPPLSVMGQMSSFMGTTLLLVIGYFLPLIYLLFAAKKLHSPLIARLSFDTNRNLRLSLQAKMFSGDSDPANEQKLEAHIPHREKQRKAVLADKSFRFNLNWVARGILTEFGDGYAPDAGLPFIFSVETLSTHLAVLAGTGAGKTSGVLRPIAKKWISNDLGGCFALCGKNQLSVEFSDGKDFPDYKLIGPGYHQAALFEGLIAEEVYVTTLLALRDNAKRDPFFDPSAETLYRNCLIVLECAVASNPMDFKWCPYDARRMVIDPKFRLAAMKEAKLAGNVDPVFKLSLTMALIDLETIEAKRSQGGEAMKTEDNIVGTVDTWLAKLVAHRDLLPMMQMSEGGINPGDVCFGAMIGVAAPHEKYGAAGTAITQLIKARVYKTIYERGDNWRNLPGHKPVMVVIDEAQDVITAAEADNSARMRSLGLYYVIATQSYASIVDKLGSRDKADKMLGNFMNLVVLRCDEETASYVSRREGLTFRRVASSGGSSLAYGVISKQVIEGTGVSRAEGKSSGVVKSFAKGVASDVSVGGIGTKLGGIESISAIKNNSIGADAMYKCGVAPVVEKVDLDMHLGSSHYAYASFLYGGVRRRDFIELSPEFAQ